MKDAAIVAALVLLLASSHMLLSSRGVRARLVGRLGERAFLAAYSLIALVFFVPLFHHYFTHRHLGPLLWAVPDSGAVTALLELANAAGLTMLVSGLVSRGPAPFAGKPLAEPRGVYRITRHPVFMGVTLMALAHGVANGPASDVAFFGGIAAFALVSCAIRTCASWPGATRRSGGFMRRRPSCRSPAAGRCAGCGSCPRSPWASASPSLSSPAACIPRPEAADCFHDASQRRGPAAHRVPPVCPRPSPPARSPASAGARSRVAVQAPNGPHPRRALNTAGRFVQHRCPTENRRHAVNRTQLSARIAARSPLSRADAATAVDAVVSAIADALASGEDVAIAGFPISDSLFASTHEIWLVLLRGVAAPSFEMRLRNAAFPCASGPRPSIPPSPLQRMPRPSHHGIVSTIRPLTPLFSPQ